jgi:hypothetical protein
MQVEYPDRVMVQRKGFSVRASSSLAGDNWFHFAIPTPVIVDDQRLKAGAAMVRFKSDGRATVRAIHVYDGERKIAGRDNLNLGPTQWHTEMLDIPGQPDVLWGIGISVYVAYPGALEFSAAGCDFER